jgi:hypothetical protein
MDTRPAGTAPAVSAGIGERRSADFRPVCHQSIVFPVAQESKAPKTATKNKAFVVSPARFIPADLTDQQNPGKIKKKQRTWGAPPNS